MMLLYVVPALCITLLALGTALLLPALLLLPPGELLRRVFHPGMAKRY